MIHILLIALSWLPPAQAHAAKPGNGAFVEAVVRSLNDVHDTRSARAVIDVPDDEGRRAAPDVLRRSAAAIAARMEPWIRHPNQRIRDIASYVRQAAGDLEDMAAAFDDLREGRQPADAAEARLRGEREELGVMLFSMTLIGTSDVTYQQVPLTRSERAAVVKLITSLFPTNTNAADPEVFAVRAFKSRYQ